MHDAEAKFWLDVEAFEVVEAVSFNMSAADMRTVRKIILEHFEYIVSEWIKFEEKKHG